MKNIVKWLLIAVVLVGVIVGAKVLYDNLSEQYNNENIAQTEAGTATDTENVDDGKFAAPDFTVLDYNGNEVKLSDYKGKPIILNFWATWCYYCKEEMPNFELAAENYPEIQFMMVNATDGKEETQEKAKKYIEDEKYTFDVFFDTELEAVMSYGVTGFPMTFFIDKDGNLLARASGAIDYDILLKGIDMITE